MSNYTVGVFTPDEIGISFPPMEDYDGASKFEILLKPALGDRDPDSALQFYKPE